MSTRLTGYLTYQQLHFKWPYGDVRLQQVELSHELGDHAKLRITGSIPLEQEDAIINEADSSDHAELWYSDSNGEQHPLFLGQLYRVDIERVYLNLQVTIQVVSHSFKLDVELKERSFQHVDYTYCDIIDAVLADYPNSDKLDEAFGSKKTGQFIMQYQETDWTFIQRLASHVGAMVVPAITAHRPQIWIGMPQATQDINLVDVPFRKRRRIADFMQREACGAANTSAEDYTGYTFDWPDMLNLGDEVNHSGHTYLITKKTGSMVQGIMNWSYECVKPEGIKTVKTYNRAMIGAAIEGRIIEVNRNQVRLHLDMDDEQNPSKARWFPYSAEGNQVWYLMPETGAQVKLYFPTYDEDDAMVVQSVRTTPSGSRPSASGGQGALNESPAEKEERKMQDPGVKSFANPQGKEFSLGDSELAMSAQEGSLYISMNNFSGVNLASTQSIRIYSGSGLSLSAGSIMLQGSEGLYVNTSTSSIEQAVQFNHLSPKMLLEASRHEVYSEPLLSEFEKQVAEKGIDAVSEERKKANNEQKRQGSVDSVKDILSGLWNTVVDIGDAALTGVVGSDEDVRQFYSLFNGGKPVGSFLERNAAAKGVVDNVNYVGDVVTGKRSPSEVKEDALRVFQDQFVEPVTRAALDQFTSPLAYTSEEAYEAGRAVTETNVMALEAAATVASGGAAAAARASRMLRQDVPNGRRAGVGGASLLERFTKQGAKPDGGGGVKKITTNAIVLPKSLSELEAYLQTLANRMNHAIARNNPLNNTSPRLGIAGIGRMDFSDHHRDLDNNRKSYSFYENRKDHNDQDRNERREKESTEGTGNSRKLDETVDAEFISKVKEMKKNLPSKIRNKYNFGYAEVNIQGLNKKDYYAHSGINKIEDLEDTSARAKIQDISTEPLGKDKLFTTQKVNRENIVDGDGAWDRSKDTEFKILNEVASSLGDKTDVAGNIKLYTDLDCCPSCSNVIRQFKAKYPNITIEVIYKTKGGAK
ncbi:deaminase domain-containing protein [Paenibacillus terreus]|uniref:deaminase domain-containing protein n=1 Tax=Paenibacillus terreus TaxID=1387834 RepID=UPI0035CD197F